MAFCLRPFLKLLLALSNLSLINNRMVRKRIKIRGSEGRSNGWGQLGRSLGVRQYPWLCPRAARFLVEFRKCFHSENWILFPLCYSRTGVLRLRRSPQQQVHRSPGQPGRGQGADPAPRPFPSPQLLPVPGTGGGGQSYQPHGLQAGGNRGLQRRLHSQGRRQKEETPTRAPNCRCSRAIHHIRYDLQHIFFSSIFRMVGTISISFQY